MESKPRNFNVMLGTSPEKLLEYLNKFEVGDREVEIVEIHSVKR